MAKRLQQDSGEERVTAKSRPMMSLIARVPSNVSSSTSVSPGKRSHGNQNPSSTTAEKEEGPGRPDVGSDRKTAFDYYEHEQFMESFSSASYSKWDDDHAWSSQEWKTDTEMCERPGRPDVTSWGATRESQPCSLTRKLSMIVENNTSFSVKFSARVFLSMSSEFTFGDNSDKSSIKKKFYEFG